MEIHLTERTQLILFFSIATFVIVVFIAVVLIRRHGHTVETHAIRNDIAGARQEAREHIKGMRQQMDNEHQAMNADIKTTKGWMLRMLNRFGFLHGRSDE
jgi:ABC-type nickel/cobalt efflux system permease component RcnA